MTEFDITGPVALEAAARALCRHAGNPENTAFEGRPMWMSYLPEARAALEAVAHKKPRRG